jgi:hypothetical protein
MSVAYFRLRRLALSVIAVVVTATAAFGGHELPVYPSYYPHEVKVSTVPPERAEELLRDGKVQAYIGATWRGAADPAPSLRSVESLGSFVTLTTNPTFASGGSPCDAITAAARQLAGTGGFSFHPYPVTPFHGEYLYYVDRAEAAKARLTASMDIAAPIRIKATDAAADLVPNGLRETGPNWDVTVDEVDAAELLTSSAMPINGWLGPPWLKAGWYHAWRLLRNALDGDARESADELARRLQTGDWRDDVEWMNLQRDLVAVLTGSCRKLVLGYTVKREYYTGEFTDGVENVGFDSLIGLAGPMFLRTVKLKNFPWNGWLVLGTNGAPRAAWNPIAGFTDGFGRLLWSAIGDPALVPAPYDAGWMLNRGADVHSSAAP